MLNRCGSVNDKIGVLLAQNLPKLRALHLAFTQVTGVTVKELVCTLLRISDPEFGCALSRADLFWVCYRCLPAYYHQKLPGDSEKANADSESLTQITKHFSDPKVTDVEAKGAVTVPKGNLKFLCVDDCNSMGIDAVEWARSKGLIVAFSFPDLKTGRKIR